MKIPLLLAPVLLVLAGCRSDVYYQEKAVEAAREFVFEHARELTAEQYAFVKFNPPVILNGLIFGAMDGSGGEHAVPGAEQRQICIVWRVPESTVDYLVFGMSDPRMAFWKPLRLIRRRVKPSSPFPAAAMTQARDYAVTALHGQLEKEELNLIRFAHPELLQTSFRLVEDGESAPPRPWCQGTVPPADRGEAPQLSLVWNLKNGRCAVFCGTGKKDLSGWQIRMAGILEQKELRENTVKHLRSSRDFLFTPEQSKPASPAPKQALSSPKQAEAEKTVSPPVQAKTADGKTKD